MLSQSCVWKRVCAGMFSVAAVGALMLTPVAAQAQQAEDDQLPANFLESVKPGTFHGDATAGGGVLGRKTTGGVLGIDSLPNFSSYFYRGGQDSSGFDQYTWPFTLIGNAPDDDRDDRDGRGRDRDERSKTTWINAPIVPVNVDLRNADGTPRFVNGQRLFYDATQFVDKIVKSPVFANSNFTSSRRPTQYADAIHRAQFFSVADDDWHTLMKPIVKPARTIVLTRGTYSFALNADGTCCRFILVDLNTFANKLFPATSDNSDTASIMGAAERAGDIRTTDFSTFLFPNTFLFDTLPSNCCILGFHSYDLQAGDASNRFRERRYVMNYSSWISPGIFSGGFQDITAFSHEVAEAFSDPFVNNWTPWWLDPTGNICQNNLENGDTLEALADPTYAMLVNGFTYHPQNVTLLQWFVGQQPSSAIAGAYTFPNLTLQPTPSLSYRKDCTAPLP